MMQNQKYLFLYIYFFHNWLKKLFSEENKVPKALFEAREVAGSAKLTGSISLFVSNFFFQWEFIY